jgi:uncharacterized C2H2 Zn-finger protein
VIVSFTRVSDNKKTGPIPNTMTVKDSCPDSCPWKLTEECYPNFSPLGIQWIALSHNGYFPGGKTPEKKRITPREWGDMCAQVRKLPRGQVWRHNTAGDLPGVNEVIDTKLLSQLVDANKGRKGFTYTHKQIGYSGQALINAQAIYAANKSGFRVNLSADSLQQADEYADMNIAPVVVVVPSDTPNKAFKTPKGRQVIICPAETKNKDGDPVIQCDRCQLCVKERRAIVAFRAHGTRKNAVNRRLKVIQDSELADRELEAA